MHSAPLMKTGAIDTHEGHGVSPKPAISLVRRFSEPNMLGKTTVKGITYAILPQDMPCVHSQLGSAQTPVRQMKPSLAIVCRMVETQTAPLTAIIRDMLAFWSIASLGCQETPVAQAGGWHRPNMSQCRAHQHGGSQCLAQGSLEACLAHFWADHSRSPHAAQAQHQNCSLRCCHQHCWGRSYAPGH
jgi:hypothetical protein